MGNIINVLITGAGAPGIAGTIYSLRNNDQNRQFRIVTTDIKDEPVGKFFSDNFYRLPAPEDKKYEEILWQIIKRENINVLIPQTTREIIKLSLIKDELNKKQIGVVVSNHNAIQKANDKYLIIKECEKTKVPYPQYYLVQKKNELIKAIEELGYPDKKVVVKPRLSNGLRGVRIISEDILTIEKYLNEKPYGLEIDLQSFLKIFRQGIFPELLVTEYLEGNEYTIDAFRNNEGIIVIPRLRQVIRSGISFETIIEMRKDLIEYSEKLAESLNLEYCFGFQFKLDKEGIPKILESNPRVQGTMVSSVFAGFNMIYYSVLQALGESVDINNVKIKEGIQFKRYWGGVGIDEGISLGKI